MADVSKMNQEELDELMTQCRIRQYELKKSGIASMKEEALQNVGRCFRIGDSYAKIIGIPKVELTKTDILYNPYQYPCIRLGNRPNQVGRGTDLVPFYCDSLHSSTWGVVRDPFHSHVEEVELDEFVAEWKRLVDEFMRQYITNVIGGVNCGG